jgi:hypothetical protein
MADLKQLYTQQKEQIEKELKEGEQRLLDLKAEQSKLKAALKFINNQLSEPSKEKN